MLNWYDWIFMGVGIIIIILCLIEGDRSEGASGAITGGVNVFVKTKERGAEKVISILTMILAIVFFIIAIVIEVTSAAGAAPASSDAALRVLF